MLHVESGCASLGERLFENGFSFCSLHEIVRRVHDINMKSLIFILFSVGLTIVLQLLAETPIS